MVAAGFAGVGSSVVRAGFAGVNPDRTVLATESAGVDFGSSVIAMEFLGPEIELSVEAAGLAAAVDSSVIIVDSGRADADSFSLVMEFAKAEFGSVVVSAGSAGVKVDSYVLSTMFTGLKVDLSVVEVTFVTAEESTEAGVDSSVVAGFAKVDRPEVEARFAGAELKSSEAAEGFDAIEFDSSVLAPVHGSAVMPAGFSEIAAMFRFFDVQLLFFAAAVVTAECFSATEAVFTAAACDTAVVVNEVAERKW